MDIDHKTYLRWNKSLDDKRKGPIKEPKNKLSKEEIELIISTCTSKEFRDLPPSVIVPKLADKGIYIASVSSFYNILRKNKLLVHRGKSKAPIKNRPAPLIAYGPNKIWSWDITYLKSNIKGNFFYLYMFMDIFSRKIVGFDIFLEESMENSSAVVQKAASAEKIRTNQLILHSDNGGAMKGATMLATLQNLGIVPSFSRPRVSDDNPYSEALFKTLKYVPKYPDCFSSIEDAKKWVSSFVETYNNHHFHSGIKFVTPNSRHNKLDKNILENRKRVFEQAKAEHPERWGTRETRNWNWNNQVYLNYLQETAQKKSKNMNPPQSI